LRVSISPPVADEEDHRAKSSANQAFPLPVVDASTCRTRLEAADGRTAPMYPIRVACESGAELSIETMPVTDMSIGKKPSRNQNASSAARFAILALLASRQVGQAGKGLSSPHAALYELKEERSSEIAESTG
jgi:hypothetical protein